MKKEQIRKQIWDLMEERNIARFPRPVHGRIPNFIGAEQAALRLKELAEWKKAKVVKANPDSPQRSVRKDQASTIKGAFKYGSLVAPGEMRRVDLIVAGSVCVNQDGARVGKGGGYSDLEYALGKEFGIVNMNTKTLTTVHPIQVVSYQIEMCIHDFPLDFIITSERIIGARNTYPKPRGIYWEELDKEKIQAIPQLGKLRKQRVK
ncbi:MAG: hypothetical protein AMJ42_06210 [Deltaproteobacteria bacterium DG_8]|nr:MAG: hypothetical protein AMJ42_06210 [Deltaproteobacteria bacterium DG_8]